MGLDISLLYPLSPLAFFFIMGGGRNWEIQKRLEIPHNEDTGKKTFHFGFPHNAKRIERASEWDEISCRLHTIDMGLDWIGFTGRLACLYFWVAIILSTASYLSSFPPVPPLLAMQGLREEGGIEREREREMDKGFLTTSDSCIYFRGTNLSAYHGGSIIYTHHNENTIFTILSNFSIMLSVAYYSISPVKYAAMNQNDSKIPHIIH